MGITDDLVVTDVSILPVPKELQEKCKNTKFQTKSFGNFMGNYELRPDGIYRQDFESFIVPKNERPYPDAEEGSIESMFGVLGRKNGKWKKVNRTLEFSFYSDIDGEWVEFEGIMCQGNVLELKKSRIEKYYLDKQKANR